MPRVFDRKRMTKLILVRHGHVEGISPERFRGRAELPLTETGHREADATAKRIAASWRPAAVYTSPLGRCVETGAAIGKALGLAPSVVLRLNDIDYGDWQGLTRDEAYARWPAEIDLWYAHPDWAAIPGGETLQQVLARGVSTVRDIVRRILTRPSSSSRMTASIACCCCMRSNCRCRATGGSSKARAASTRSISARTAG